MNKHNSGFTYIFAIIFGVIVLGVVVLVVIASLGLKTPNDFLQSNKVATLPPDFSISIDPTTNLKTYTNNKYSFTFEYPDDWRLGKWDIFASETNFTSKIISLVVKNAHATASFMEYSPLPYNFDGKELLGLWLQNTDEDKTWEEVSPTKPNHYQYSVYNGGPLGIFLNVWSNPSNKTLTELKDEYHKFVDINGTTGLNQKLLVPPEGEFFQAIWGYESIVIIEKDYIYTIFYAGRNYKKQFNQILSTFQFLEDFQVICEENKGTWLGDFNECESLYKDICEENGGQYSECESACRHFTEEQKEQGAGCITACIEVCAF